MDREFRETPQIDMNYRVPDKTNTSTNTFEVEATKRHRIIAVTFYILGTLAALYCGAFLFLIRPLYLLYTGFINHTLTFFFCATQLICIMLSGTVFGFVWCIGYVLFNHFMGTEDPDWDALNPKDEAV